MRLLDHVSIGGPELERARPLHDAILPALGCDKVCERPGALGYGVRCRADTPDETCLAVHAYGAASGDDARHGCFKAGSRAAVDAFNEAANRAGGTSDGAPGPREHYHPSCYAAFVRDPAGNRIEAVCHVEE